MAALAAWRYHGDPRAPYDAFFHVSLGRQWTSGIGPSSSAEISAGYPLFVASVDLARRLVTPSPPLSLALGLAQGGLLGALIVLTAVLGRQVAGRAAGLSAAAVLAVWPNVVLAAVVAHAELLTMVLAVAVVMVLGHGSDRRHLAVAGGLTGLAIEVRPAAAVLLLVFLTVPAGAALPTRLRALGIGGLVALLVIVPFALRSSYVTRSFVPFDLRAGVNLCLGRAPESDGGPTERDACPVPRGVSALEANRLRTEQAWEHLREHPGREPGLVVGRLRSTLWADDASSVEEIDRESGRHLHPDAARHLTTWSTALSRIVLVLAVIGTLAAVARVRAWRRPALAGWLLLVPVAVSLGDPRYRMASLPFFAVLAAAVVSAGARRVALRGGESSSVPRRPVGSL